MPSRIVAIARTWFHAYSLFTGTITRRHPFELLVGDYLTMPIGRGGLKTIGVYLMCFAACMGTGIQNCREFEDNYQTLERIFHDFLRQRFSCQMAELISQRPCANIL